MAILGLARTVCIHCVSMVILPELKGLQSKRVYAAKRPCHVHPCLLANKAHTRTHTYTLVCRCGSSATSVDHSFSTPASLKRPHTAQQQQQDEFAVPRVLPRKASTQGGARTHMHTHVCTRTNFKKMCIHTHSQTHTYIHITYKHTVHTHTHTYTRTHTYTHTHTHTRAHTHTHTQLPHAWHTAASPT